MLTGHDSMGGLDRMSEVPATCAGDPSAMDRFLRGVERRALRMAELGTVNREEAMDVVQDAMFGFVRHYSARPSGEWPPLFWRVLDSRLNDWHRRQRVRGRWLGWFDRGPDDAEHDDAISAAPDPAEPGPLARMADGEATAALESALRALPPRQRQAFLLRLWEGLDVADTAAAMRCSEGSVKTHLFRALANLRSYLEAHR